MDWLSAGGATAGGALAAVLLASTLLRLIAGFIAAKRSHKIRVTYKDFSVTFDVNRADDAEAFVNLLKESEGHGDIGLRPRQVDNAPPREAAE